MPRSSSTCRPRRAEHGDAVGVGGEILDAGAELERRCRARRARPRRAPLADRRDGSPSRARRSGVRHRAERNAHDLAAGAAGHHADRLRRDAERAAARASPSAIRTRVALGESWMPAPVSSSLRGLFEHGDAQAGARQRQRRRQPADAGAGDDDMTRGRQGSSSRCGQAAAVSGSAHSAGRAACGSSAGSKR